MNNIISVDNTLNIIENQNTTRKNNNFKEVSNIYPPNITKILLHPKNRKTVVFVRNEAYGICRNKMSTEYIRYAFNKFDRGFIYYSENTNIPFAFCLWENRNMKNSITNNIVHSEIYISLICGRGADFKTVPYILDDLVQLCRQNNIQYISLVPANQQLRDYYISCGFEDNGEYLKLDAGKSRMKSMSRGRKTRKQLRSTST